VAEDRDIQKFGRRDFAVDLATPTWSATTTAPAPPRTARTASRRRSPPGKTTTSANPASLSPDGPAETFGAAWPSRTTVAHHLAS